MKKKTVSKLKKCKHCNIDFLSKRKDTKNNPHIYCSHKCNILEMKKNAFNFNCKICGVTVYTQPSQMKYRNRITCSKECLGKYRRIEAEKRRRELGYTKHQLDRLERYSPEMKKWRIAVFERDNYTCQLCGIRGNYIEADHIKPFAYFEELRYTLSNGRTLCRPCHNTTKISAKKMKELYGKR